MEDSEDRSSNGDARHHSLSLMLGVVHFSVADSHNFFFHTSCQSRDEFRVQNHLSQSPTEQHGNAYVYI